MLKNKLIILFLFVCTAAFSQIQKGTGITYTNGVPTQVPRLSADSEINIDVSTGKIYRWNRTASQWRLIAEGIDVGNFSGAPTYTPGYGQSPFVINLQRQLYYFSGGWTCLTCGFSPISFKNGLTRTIDTVTLGGNLDRNTAINAKQFNFTIDSALLFRTQVATTSGSASQVFSMAPSTSGGINLTSTSTSNVNVNTNFNLRPGNMSQLISRNDLNNYYLRLNPDSLIVGGGAISSYLNTDKRLVFANDSLFLKNIEYSPTKNIDYLVITPDGVVFKDSTALSPTLVAGQGISISGDTIINTGDLNAANEIQWIDSFYISNDTLFLSLSLDTDTTSWVKIPALAGGNGIYGGSGTVPGVTVATIDNSLLFSSQEAQNQFAVSMTNSLSTFGSSMITKADSLALRYFDVASDSRVTVNSNGVLLRTQTPDRVIIQGADARYQADYRSTYGDRSLIDKKFADDTYARNGMNIGSGSGVFAAKVDSILQFKSLFGSTGIDISSNSTTITFKADTTLLATVYDVSQKQDAITGGASSIVSSNLTVNRALVSDGSGKVAVSNITSTEVGYLSGVTSNIQTQLGGKEPTIAAGTASQYWAGNKTWQTLNTAAVAESTNLYYTDTRSRNAISETITGIDYTSSTGVFSLTSGYVIPTTTQESNWNTAYTNRITSLTTTGNSGTATLVSNVLNIPNYTLTGLGGFANPMTTLGDVIYGAASGTPTRLAGNTTTTKQFLSQTGTGSASAVPSWSTVTKSDVGLSNVENTALSTWAGSTNITTLGTVTTGTWNASTIAVNRGGTGATTLTGVLVGNGTSAVTGVAGTANQLLRRNSGNTAYEFFTPNYLTSNQTITLTGDVTGSGTTSITTTIGTNVVSNSMLATVAPNTFKGRVSIGTGPVEDLTATQATSLLDVFTSTTKGLVPSPAGATTTFLRADGTWATPSATGGITSLNSLTTASQTFATGTSGTDFNISSNTSTHTFNLPAASATNTGKLTSTDWNTFNSKESALTFNAPLTRNVNTISADTTVLATQYDLSISSMDSIYNGNRPIKRVPTVGTNLQATTFRQWLNWWYVDSYTQPSISLNSLSPTPVEVGSSTNYTLSGATNNPCSFTLSGGTVNGNSFGAATSYSFPYTHLPTTHGTTTITATQSWNQTGTTCEVGTPTTGTISASRSITNVYPVLWGMSSVSYTGGAVPYSGWSKRVTTEGNQTGLTMTGTNQFIYILIPKSWSDFDVSSIIDHNGFNVTSSFTAYDVTVTSTGLTNNWTQNYKLYKLNNLTTANGFNYIYNR